MSTRLRNGVIVSRCFACNFRGTVLDLVGTAHRLDVRRDFPAVVAKTAQLFGLSGADAPPPPPPPSVPPPSRGYPPDAPDVWDRCGSVFRDREIRAALTARRIDAAAVADLDLARVLPRGLLPPWCARWKRTGHGLVVPLRDVRGNIASLHGRILTPCERDLGKGRFARGFARVGLVMADAVACDLLATRTASPWWSGEVHFAEGATDYLCLASRWSHEAERLPATFGIVDGAWTEAHAARIPVGAVVRILTDPDEKGRLYAAHIASTLRHCRVVRMELKGTSSHD